jgi:hypothetical protein
MIEEKIVQDLKAKHGDVYRLKALGHEFLVRGPSVAEWRRFKATISDKAKRPFATEQLARDCVVHPPKEEVEALFTKYPALPESLADKIAEIGGATEEVEVEKL